MGIAQRIENGIAYVSFSEKGPVTLSNDMLASLAAVVEWLELQHAKTPLVGVILTGNEYGFGVGANIFELADASEDFLCNLIDRGHKVLDKIEESPFPWIAVLPAGHCLGGMCEVALACKARVAHPKAKIGLPEVGLNVIPGLGGTQRLPRLIGLVPAIDLILKGKIVPTAEAKALGMIDAVLPDGVDLMVYAEYFLRKELPNVQRPEHDFSDANEKYGATLPMVRKMTGGRNNPRAPFVALEVITKGVQGDFCQGLEFEQNKFVELATSREGRAGMRNFMTKQAVERQLRLPSTITVPEIEWVGVAGIDGVMGNAIAFLALQAGYKVVGWVPETDLQEQALQGLRKKFGELIKRGKCDEATRDRLIGSVPIMSTVSVFDGCDLVIEAIVEKAPAKAAFYGFLAAAVQPETIVVSNSSGMGPNFLGQFFLKGGGQRKQVAGLHFFNPAERPTSPLVEIINGDETSPGVLAALHVFSRKLGKTPIMLEDRAVGFLVNAGLMAYVTAADRLYCAGTPIETIDQAMRTFGFPMGPFELMDYVGIDTAAGLADFMQANDTSIPRLLIQALRDIRRFGMKNGGGFYQWLDGKPTAVWEGLSVLCPERQGCIASDIVIVDCCLEALTTRVEELVRAPVVGSREEADLAFVLGIGFPQYLGGPLFYKETRAQGPVAAFAGSNT